MQAPPNIEGILRHLETAEAAEPDPWLRDDLRIAWLTVLYANRGYSEPFVSAFYRVLGIHPDRLPAAIEARRRAQLGRLYDLVTGSSSLPPKKPSVSVRSIPAPATKHKTS